MVNIILITVVIILFILGLYLWHIANKNYEYDYSKAKVSFTLAGCVFAIWLLWLLIQFSPQYIPITIIIILLTFGVYFWYSDNYDYDKAKAKIFFALAGGALAVWLLWLLIKFTPQYIPITIIIILLTFGVYFWYSDNYDYDKTKAKIFFALAGGALAVWLVWPLIQIIPQISILFWVSIVIGIVLLLLLFTMISYVFNSPPDKFGCIGTLSIIGLCIVSAFCGWSARPQPNAPPAQIHFTGYVLDQNNTSGIGMYPNDRLVVLYYNGKEKSRTITKTGKTNSSEMKDGFFEITIDNVYELSPNSIKGSQQINNMVSSYLEIFSPVIREGENVSFLIYQKGIEYKIKVFSGKSDLLPRSIQGQNTTEWSNGKLFDLGIIQDATSKFKDSIASFKNVNVQITGQDEILGEYFEAGTNNNCSSTLSYNLKTTLKRELIHEFVLNTSFNIIDPLEASLGYKNGEIETIESEIATQIPAHSNIVIGVTPIYLWDKGIIQIAGQVVEFKAKKGVRFEISPKELPCQ